METISNNNTSNNNTSNNNTSNNNNELIASYINSLNAIELKALEIAKQQLQSSFDVEKSIGFLEFLKSKN